MNSKRSIVLSFAVPAVTLIAVLVVWALAAASNETFILPSPRAVITSMFDNWGVLVRSLWNTLSLALAALATAIVGGVGLAVVMVRSRWIELALYPYAVVVQVTPIIAITPLILIWIEDTTLAILVIASIISFFPILSNTAQGLKSIDHNLLNLFELYEARPRQILRMLRAPTALPYFLTGLRIAGGLALVGTVVAELVAGRAGAGSGLAYRIYNAQTNLDTPLSFAALLLLALAGVAIFGATSIFSHLAIRSWHESESPREN